MVAKKKSKVVSKNVIISNELGLHARAAVKIAKLAGLATAKIWLSKGVEKVDAASIIDILTIAATKGSRITLTADDPADSEVLNKIEKLFLNKFGE